MRALEAMVKWHVWGDFSHTRPEQIGAATAINEDDRAARKTAEAHGFDFERRMRNGFEPWATTFVAESDDDQEFEFASYPIVRGWQKI